MALQVHNKNWSHIIHPRLGPEDSEELRAGPARPRLPGDSSEGGPWLVSCADTEPWLAGETVPGPVTGEGSDSLLLSSIENSAASRAVLSAASRAQGEQL